jgi:5-oxoprolinase (ATP-hydrolysing) subunit A
MAAITCDINCDMGEGMANDAAIMPFISSANIACGYHAGNEQTIWDTVKLASEYNVAAGAHVSFLDPDNFGRKEMELPASAIYELVTQQLIIIQEIIGQLEVKLHHVKPHGALYNMAAKDPVMARAIAEAVRDFDDQLILYGLSNSYLVKEAAGAGLKSASEVFADRVYLDNGSLMPRSKQGALIEEEEKAIQQVLQMIQKKTVTTLSGKEIPVTADTICLHGDNVHAAKFAKSIYETLKQNQVALKAL